jgi:hypothetical protein
VAAIAVAFGVFVLVALGLVTRALGRRLKEGNQHGDARPQGDEEHRPAP